MSQLQAIQSILDSVDTTLKREAPHVITLETHFKDAANHIRSVAGTTPSGGRAASALDQAARQLAQANHSANYGMALLHTLLTNLGGL